MNELLTAKNWCLRKVKASFMRIRNLSMLSQDLVGLVWSKWRIHSSNVETNTLPSRNDQGRHNVLPHSARAVSFKTLRNEPLGLVHWSLRRSLHLYRSEYLSRMLREASPAARLLVGP